MKHLAEVHILYAENARSIPDMLRRSAASLESEGAEGCVRTSAMIAVQVGEDGSIQVYGWGETDMLHALGSLTAGAQQIGNIILDDGQ